MRRLGIEPRTTGLKGRWLCQLNAPRWFGTKSATDQVTVNHRVSVSGRDITGARQRVSVEETRRAGWTPARLLDRAPVARHPMSENIPTTADRAGVA